MSSDIYQSYEEGSARERAELIFTNYCRFSGILDKYRARLIYEIQAEEQFCRSHNKDELGVRIQKLGAHSDPTAKEAINNISLEESVEGKGKIVMSDRVSLDTQIRLNRKHHVLIVMKEEYGVFGSHLHSLCPEDLKIIIPFLEHSKDYYQLSEETGRSVEYLRKRVCKIRKTVIEDVITCFKERI